MNEESDYIKYRGRCKLMSEALIKQDPSLTLVRGYYYCPFWGKQPHWWVKDCSGNIIDPTVDQFPSKGCGEYIEFDGNINCSNCDKVMHENDPNVRFESNHAFCSTACNMRFVGL